MNREKIEKIFKGIVKIFTKVKVKKILVVILAVFVVLTALYFWSEKAFNFFQPEDELAGLPCYKGDGLATIEIRGEITPYFIYTPVSEESEDPEAPDATSSEEVIMCIDNIRADKSIKGVIVEIDSYGGSPVGAEEIMNAIKSLGKPTAAVVREMAVSGGYLIATATDRIFASEWSDIGSIGVTMSYLDNSDKNTQEGLYFNQLSAGKFKDTGNPDKPLTAEEEALFMRDTNILYEGFIKNVAANRNLDIEEVRKLADGSSMLGAAAKENGLIDEIGDRNSAGYWLENNNF